MNFDLHVIMMHYCTDEYIIVGDPPYKLKMITMLTGKRPTGKQLAAWSTHYIEWSTKKRRMDSLLKRDDEIDALYLKAQRRNDVVTMKKLEQEGSDIVAELKSLDILSNALDDFNKERTK